MNRNDVVVASRLRIETPRHAFLSNAAQAIEELLTSLIIKLVCKLAEATDLGVSKTKSSILVYRMALREKIHKESRVVGKDGTASICVHMA